MLLDRCKSIGIDKLNIRNDFPEEVRGKTKELLTSINYLFIKQVYAASKTIKKLNRKESIEMVREEVLMKIEDLELSTNCSDDEEIEEKDTQPERLLNTKYVTCWLLKNI